MSPGPFETLSVSFPHQQPTPSRSSWPNPTDSAELGHRFRSCTVRIQCWHSHLHDGIDCSMNAEARSGRKGGGGLGALFGVVEGGGEGAFIKEG